MEKRAVVTKYSTPDVKACEGVLSKNASAIEDYMDRLAGEDYFGRPLSSDASREDERTYEDEAKASERS